VGRVSDCPICGTLLDPDGTCFACPPGAVADDIPGAAISPPTTPAQDPPGGSTPDPPAGDPLLAGLRDGAWLDAQQFDPLRYAVPGLIPEGFTLLIGPPKAGKSWLILAILLARAAGGAALGRIRVPKGRVLYLALEDGDRRMQDRCRTLMAGEALPADFCYLTRITPTNVLATIEAFLTRYPDTVLVVIDTLGKVMPPALPNETTYGRDYRVGGRIKAIADGRPGLAVVALHHDRKAGSEDFVERVSGTNGLAGSADTILVLSRARQSEDGLLAVTGRDVVESEYALTMSGGSWNLDGVDLAAAARRAQERAATQGLGDRSADVIRFVGEHPEGTGPAAIAAAIGLDAKTVAVYLSRACQAGRIIRAARGLYVPNPVGSVGFGQSNTAVPNTHNTNNSPLNQGDPTGRTP
jgi:AAA domain